MRIKLNQFGDGIALRPVVRIAARLPVEPECAVSAWGHCLDIGTAVENLHAAVRVHRHTVGSIRIFRDRLRYIIVKLHTFAGVEIKAEDDLGIGIVGDFLAIFIGVSLLSAVRNAGGKVERVAGNATRANPLDILRQIKILCLVGKLRRGLVLCSVLFCLFCIVRRLRLTFAASGENAEQQNEHKADGKNPFCHKRFSFLFAYSIVFRAATS